MSNYNGFFRLKLTITTYREIRIFYFVMSDWNVLLLLAYKLQFFLHYIYYFQILSLLLLTYSNLKITAYWNLLLLLIVKLSDQNVLLLLIQKLTGILSVCLKLTFTHASSTCIKNYKNPSNSVWLNLTFST